MSIYGGPEIVTDGLACLLDAGNSKSYPGSGTSWFDISGNNRHFTWSSSPSFAYENSLAYFNTTTRTCTGPASNSFGINNTSGYTVILSCKNNSLVNSNVFQFYGSNNTGFNGFRGIFAHIPVNNIVYFDQGGCCDLSKRISVSVTNTTSWNIWAFKKDSSNRKIFRNSSTIASTTTASANIDLLSTNVIVGDNLWDTRLQSFVIYNRGLTDLEILQNYNALKGRFGL
jgi:hypothetical protein